MTLLGWMFFMSNQMKGSLEIKRLQAKARPPARADVSSSGRGTGPFSILCFISFMCLTNSPDPGRKGPGEQEMPSCYRAWGYVSTAPLSSPLEPKVAVSRSTLSTNLDMLHFASHFLIQPRRPTPKFLSNQVLEKRAQIFFNVK